MVSLQVTRKYLIRDHMYLKTITLSIQTGIRGREGGEGGRRGEGGGGRVGGKGEGGRKRILTKIICCNTLPNIFWFSIFLKSFDIVLKKSSDPFDR